MKKLVAALFLAGCVTSISFAAQPIPPAPTGDNYIIDNADILSDEQENTLNTRLKDYEDRTTTEIGVLTVPSIENDYIENFSLNVARDWGIGQKDKNNGALLLVSVTDRKLRIEVGTGLEGDLTDSRSGQIIRNRIAPEFKKGDYYKGISDGIDGMILAINAQDDPKTADPEISADAWMGVIFFGAYMFLMVLSWFASMLGRSKRWWPGGILGVGLGSGLGALASSGRLSVVIISGFVIGFFGLMFDYFVSKNYRQAKSRGDSPSWWAGGGFGGGSSGGGISGGFGGGGGFSGGGSSGSW